MKHVVKCESLAAAVLCLGKIIDSSMESLSDLSKQGVTMKTLGSMMDDYNSLVDILKECKESECSNFTILPVKDVEVEEYGVEQ